MQDDIGNITLDFILAKFVEPVQTGRTTLGESSAPFLQQAGRYPVKDFHDVPHSY